MPRLLVTNCTIEPPLGGIYLLDTDTRETRRLMDEPMRGITYAPGGIYALGNHGAIFHVDPLTLTATKAAEIPFDGCHDMKWVQGGFCLAASLGNFVARLDDQFNVTDRVQIVEDSDDVCHVNCLAELNGALYASIFTLAPGPRREKRYTTPWRTEGKILRIDFPNQRYDIAFEPLSQPHSLVWHDGRFYVCESYTSEISAVSLERGEKKVLHHEHGFIRGLAFAGGNAYVGVSRMRFKRPLAQRLREMFRMRNGVFEMDPKTWQVKRRFPLPGSETYEILPLRDS